MGTVGVILPDSSTSPRWEANDRPLLSAAFTAAGIKSDIQNADGDVTKFGTICDSMVTQGVKVLLIVDLDSDSGSACLKKAQAAGIKTIDYDRLTLGGGASYYVSFDNVAVGKLMGDGLTKCLTDMGKKKANIVMIDGKTTDNNAALFKQGYVAALKPKVDAGDYKIVGDQTGEWSDAGGRTAFEQLYTQNHGQGRRHHLGQRHDGRRLIARLKAANVNGKIPISRPGRQHRGLRPSLLKQPVHDRPQGHQEGSRAALRPRHCPDPG